MTSSLRVTAALAGLFALACSIALACGPGGFDGLTGGAPRDAGADGTTIVIADPDLPAPRPIAPISVSWVNSSRPTLSWELPHPLTGAVVELCRTRTCEAIDKTYDVSGRAWTATDDLAQGMWFWRLRGRAPGRVTVRASPVWQFLVRGPSPRGAASTGWGALVDVNGDGQCDLLAGATATSGPQARGALLVYSGEPTGIGESAAQSLDSLGRVLSIAAGVDVNGDGFSDVVVATEGDAILPDGGTTRILDFVVYQGTPKGLVLGAFRSLLPYPLTAGATVAAAGDVNGDGYGDILATASGAAIVLLGSADGLSGTVGGLPTDATFPPSSARIGVGALDADGDGLADLVVGTARSDGPASLLLGRRSGPPDVAIALRGDADFRPQATGVAALDMNGDGLADVAFAAAESRPSPGQPLLALACVSLGPAPLMRALRCSADLESARWGSLLVGADVDGDGQDELVIGSDFGVDYLTKNDLDVVEVTELSFVRITGLTTIVPGLRPTPARWAAVQHATGNSPVIAVREGTRRTQTLRPPTGFELDGAIR